MRTSIIVNPTGDKGILANHVILKRYIFGMMRSRLISIYHMVRGSTQVGFEHDLEPLKFGISTYHFKIKRMWKAKIPGRDSITSNTFKCKDWIPFTYGIHPKTATDGTPIPNLEIRQFRITRLPFIFYLLFSLFFISFIFIVLYISHCWLEGARRRSPAIVWGTFRCFP